MPRVSVLLPCRDAEAYLPDAIASLEAQSFCDFEVVAVDDGSADRTGALLQRWAQRDRRVQLGTQPPLGIVAALRRAADAARGDVLIRMDADDIAHPDRIARQVDLLEHDTAVGACGTLVEYFPRVGVRGGALRYERWINALVAHADIVRDLFVECPIAHPSLAVRRATFEAAGGYRDTGWPEDYDLIFRLWLTGARFAKVDQTLLHWREGEQRASRRDERYNAAAFRRCKAHYLRRTMLRDGAAVVWGSGPVGKSFARELLRQGTPIHAFVDLDPRKIGQEIHGAVVIRPEDAEPAPGLVSLAAVGQPDAREVIRAAARERGWVEGANFVAVA